MKINFLFDNSKLLKLLWGVGNTYPSRFEAGGSRFYKNLLCEAPITSGTAQDQCPYGGGVRPSEI